MMNRKDKIIKKRKELEKKIKRSMDDLSNQDKENLQAIAIKYDNESKKAPTIVASGKGKIAKQILELAEENIAVVTELLKKHSDFVIELSIKAALAERLDIRSVK